MLRKNIALLAACLLTAISFNINAQVTDDVLSIAEQMPEYPGGEDSLMREVTANIVYPKQCLDSNIQGKVFLRFVVNEDGTISKIEVMKSPHKFLNESAIDALRKIKKFNPGKQNGKPIKVYYSIPVGFRIEDTTKQNKHVDIMPEFPGGDAALIKFLQENIQYPKFERDNGIQGKVIVKLVVMEDGTVQDISLAKSVSAGLDEEAIRVVSMSPKWKPGSQDGKPVRVKYLLPVVFKLTGGYNSQTALPKTIYDYMPDGRVGMERFVNKHLIYPPSALADKTEAIMWVMCTLGADLKLHPDSIKNSDSLFGPEAFRVINALPALDSEAKVYSSFFKQTYIIGIIFTLDKRQHNLGSLDWDKSVLFIGKRRSRIFQRWKLR
ncbi:MAG: energy transducer TonB [Bacteroidetes bacterium]|nr:energy transducer TonB [Bacteroidota bacterium]